MLSVAIRADLWDIEQQGCDDFLDRVHGELGFTDVTVPLLHPAAQSLRVRAGATPRAFTTMGGLAFQPEDDYHRATRLHPAPADWLRARNPFARLADAARQRGMRVTAELDAAGLAAWAGRQNRGVRKNAFGDVVPGGVCLNDPDARECLLGVVANVCAAHGVNGVALCGLNDTRPPADSDAVNLGPAAAWLLDLCFCESCRQQMSSAELDAAACARRAATLLETSFETGRAGYDDVDGLLNDEALLRAMRQWLLAQSASLIKSFRSLCNADVTIVCDLEDPSSLVDAARRAELAVRWSHPCTAATIEETDAAINTLAAAIGKDALELRFSMSPDRTPDAPALVRVMTRAVEAGVRNLQIDNYGSVPTVRLDWMRQAIRFATRAAD